MKQVILASASPRRKELLEQIGISFEIVVAQGEEHITKEDNKEAVMELAKQKAFEISTQMKKDCIIIGADTMVLSENKILGKPKDVQDAIKMIKGLQGKTHSVCTGVAVVIKEKEKEAFFAFVEETFVSVYPMSIEEIKDYIQTGEYKDKAGSYGIQGMFAKYIACIEGDYNNVVGLPVGRLYQELLKRKLC